MDAPQQPTTPEPPAGSIRERANSRLMLKLIGFALGAFGFGFALVPLY